MKDPTSISLFHMVFLFWIVMDALGTLPLFVTLLKHFPPGQQRKIIVREMLVALGIMISFLFFGKGFLQLLHITHTSLQIAGGILIFMLAIRMIFSSPSQAQKEPRPSPKDPLIVPLAVPSIAGPGILATITLYAGVAENKTSILFAIILAWLFSLPFLLFSPLITTLFGDNGLVTIERLFGYVLILISSQMALNGLRDAFSA